MLKAARMNVVATAGDATPRRLATAADRRAKRARDDFMFGGFCFVRFLLIYEKLLHWEIADGCSKRTLADISRKIFHLLAFEIIYIDRGRAPNPEAHRSRRRR